MNQCWTIALILLLCTGLTRPVAAQEQSAPTDQQKLLLEIMGLRVDIEQQRREIHALREEVAQLHAKIDGRPYRKTGPPTAPPPSDGPRYGDARETSEKPAQIVKVEDEPAAGDSGKTHVVKSGDTFSSISRKYKISLDALEKANPGVAPKSLRVGMELKLP